MRKVSAIAIYGREGQTCTLSVLTVNYKGDLTSLVQYADESDTAKTYDSFNKMYEAVLNIMKNNNFYCSMYEEFGVKWYDIQWIVKIKNPKYVSKHYIQ